MTDIRVLGSICVVLEFWGITTGGNLWCALAYVPLQQLCDCSSNNKYGRLCCLTNNIPHRLCVGMRTNRWCINQFKFTFCISMYTGIFAIILIVIALRIYLQSMVIIAVTHDDCISSVFSFSCEWISKNCLHSCGN